MLPGVQARLWVRNYANIDIHDSLDGHWGRGQTGFNISLSGRVFLSDGRKIKVDEGWKYPCHRDLIDGRGEDATAYSGIYSYGFREGPTLWLYPDAESSMNPAMQRGLASLIGVHRITEATAVRSNTSRQVLFTLNEVDRATGRLWSAVAGLQSPDWAARAKSETETRCAKPRP